jgi:hypothetical protein
MMKEIVIDITPAGSVVVEAKGFKGVGCDKATEQIEIAIGGTGERGKKRKPEAYSQPSTSQANKLTF